MLIEFTLEQSKIQFSKRRSIVIQIKNGEVFVKAPNRTSHKYLQELVFKKQSWIIKKLEQSKVRLEEKQSTKIQDPALLTLYKTELNKYLENKLPQLAKQVGVNYNKVAVKKMSSRWGSCSSKGNLSFSLYLWNTPIYVVDYVIIHELCHRRFMNHSKSFWSLVEQHYPEYKLVHKWLKISGKMII